jgi:GNAT superfamily N-acetyltransferase
MTAVPLAILPIAPTSTEVNEMMSVIKKAFGPDPLIEFCFNQPNVPHPTKEESIAKHLERMSSPQFVYHKAVDAENPCGPMLGVAAWYWVEDPYTAKPNIPSGDPPLGVHMQCYDASIGALRRWRTNYFKKQGKPFAIMALLTVAPEAQRRGVGSALLREGLKEVDRRGLQAFIEASPAGLGLYKKFGWEEMVESTVNLRDYGGEDVDCVTVGLVRPAGAKESSKEQPDV